MVAYRWPPTQSQWPGPWGARPRHRPPATCRLLAVKIKGSYGIDAPYVPITSGVIGLALVLVAALGARGPWFWVCLIIGLVWLTQASWYLNTTRRGKFTIWARVLKQLQLVGDERVLDVGCGRGMVLIQAALLLPDGQAVGIDLWRSHDQSGNDPEATTTNAVANDVGDRIELRTGDMCELPFADDSFDAVVSSLAIHNVKDRERRRRAVAEIYRVTKPGGRIRIVDIANTSTYRDVLAERGAEHLVLRRLGPLGWFGNPMWGSTLVAAHKPIRPAQPPAGSLGDAAAPQ